MATVGDQGEVRLDTISVRTFVLVPVRQAAGLRGLIPIMIDRSDLERGSNVFAAAIGFRRPGLPLLSWIVNAEELNPSQNRLEEFFLGRLSHHLPPRSGL